MQGMAVKKEKKKSFCQRVSPVNPRLRWSGHVPCFIGMMRQQPLEISPPPLSHGNISTHPWRKSVREGWWVDEEKMKMKAGTQMDDGRVKEWDINHYKARGKTRRREMVSASLKCRTFTHSSDHGLIPTSATRRCPHHLQFPLDSEPQVNIRASHVSERVQLPADTHPQRCFHICPASDYWNLSKALCFNCIRVTWWRKSRLLQPYSCQYQISSLRIWAAEWLLWTYASCVQCYSLQGKISVSGITPGHRGLEARMQKETPGMCSDLHES